MDILEVTVGQRSEPALTGEHTTVSSYAGLGTRHVMVLADAAMLPLTTRLAPQTVVSAIVARIRTSLYMTNEERLVDWLKTVPEPPALET